MKITRRILSIPPLITTTWSNVESIRMDDLNRLWVALYDGNSVCIPDLDQVDIDRIFRSYETVLEMEENQVDAAEAHQEEQEDAPTQSPFGMRINLGQMGSLQEGIKNIGAMLQHDYENSDAPDLPATMLDQVGQMAETLGPEHADSIPKPEPHCNCPHCQIVRAIRERAGLETDHAYAEHLMQEEEESVVTDDDLSFRDWDVQEDGDRIFTVSNPLDPSESYKVCLRDSIGCTCGHSHCEHISAALRS